MTYDWSKLDLDPKTTEILQACIDWQYLIVKSGGMARKSDCEAWAIKRYGISEYDAHQITNMITEGPRYFSISDSQVSWSEWTARRPAPAPEDYRDIDYSEWDTEKKRRSEAARALGSIRSERKSKSSAANGKKGGRPRKIQTQ